MRSCGIHRKDWGVYPFQPAEVEKVAAFLNMDVVDLFALAAHGDGFVTRSAEMGDEAPPVNPWEQPSRAQQD